MNRPFVSLCPEITRNHALTLMDWLQDEGVTRHLSDSRHVSRFIEQVIARVQLPILTHLFNQGGRFFMVCDGHDVPVGFVRLVKTGSVCEMVLVIGNRDNWGRQFGASLMLVVSMVLPSEISYAFSRLDSTPIAPLHDPVSPMRLAVRPASSALALAAVMPKFSRAISAWMGNSPSFTRNPANHLDVGLPCVLMLTSGWSGKPVWV